MANNYKHIAVYLGTKNRIDALKGRKSYDDILVDMCSYFEISCITPTSHIASPVIVMKEQSNRVIEVMRGVEKKQNITLDSIFQLVKTIASGTQNLENGQSISADDENYIHVNDVKDLLDQYKELKKFNEKTKAKNKLLLNEVEELKQQSPSSNSCDLANTDILIEIVNTIDSSKKPATFNKDIYEIDRSLFDGWMNRLKNELEK